MFALSGKFFALSGCSLWRRQKVSAFCFNRTHMPVHAAPLTCRASTGKQGPEGQPELSDEDIEKLVDGRSYGQMQQE